MKASHLLLSAAAAGLAALTGCDGGGPPDGGGGSEPPDQDQPAEVGYIELRPETLSRSDPLPGRVVAYEAAEIRPQVSGIIQSRLFEEGGYVEEGQQLYQIDPALFEAELELARANLRNTEAQVKNARRLERRLKQLVAENAVSQQQYDDAVFALDQAEAAASRAEAEIKLARINLDYTEVRSPISGYIGPSRVTRGALVTAQQAQELAVVRDLDPVYVDLAQAASETRTLRDRLTAARKEQDKTKFAATLYLDDSAEPYPHEGSLDATELAVDLQTGAIRLRSLFPNPDKVLLPGMFVRASIEEAGETEAILVPQKTVRIGPGGEKTVWVVGDGDKARQRSLRVGPMDGNHWIVREGLEAGDRLIVRGAMGLNEGDSVEPRQVETEDD